MKTLDSKKKSRFERVEPGLFRYKASGSYYTVLKKDGKTKWRNLQTDDKATARRMLRSHRVVHGMKHSKPERVTPKLVAELHRIMPYDPDHRRA